MTKHKPINALCPTCGKTWMTNRVSTKKTIQRDGCPLCLDEVTEQELRGEL